MTATDPAPLMTCAICLGTLATATVYNRVTGPIVTHCHPEPADHQPVPVPRHFFNATPERPAP